MNDKLKQTISGGFAAAMILTLVLGCNFSSNSSGETNIKSDNTDKQTVNSDTKNPSVENKKTAKSGLAGDLLGTWEGSADPTEKLTMTFKENGSLDIETDFGDEKVPVKATYRIIDEQTVEIKYSDGKTVKLTEVKISGDTMQANGKKGKPATFKRVS